MNVSSTQKPAGQIDVRAPRILTIALTGVCNCSCRHCWAASGRSPVPARVAGAALCRLLEEFAALGGEGVRFTGGEPLCHPEWLDVMRYSRSLGFRALFLQTNGMLLTDQHAEALSGLDFPGLTIEISMDGATAKTHDLLRGDGAYAGALEGIKKLVQHGMARRIALFMTEMRHNLMDIPAILEFAVQMGVASFSSGAVVRCGSAAVESAATAPGIGQYLELLDRYEQDPRFRELYQKIGRVAAIEWRSGRATRSEGCTFIEHPYLTADGTLYPCVLCHAEPFSVTGVFQKGLAAACAEGAPMWAELVRLSRERGCSLSVCLSCAGREACSGGCMGRAWGSYGDLMAPDDRCEVRRAIYGLPEAVCTRLFQK